MERVEVVKTGGVNTKDVSYTTAPLCGQHTLEVCFLNCNLELSPTVPKKQIKSYCIVMVGKDNLQFVLLAKGDQIDLVRAFQKGSKYTIRFSNIADISVLKGEDDQHLTLKKVAKAERDTKPQSIIIHLHGEAVCQIDTKGYGSTHLAKQIQSAWQSSIVLGSTRLTTLDSSADRSLANEYLNETMISIKLSSSNRLKDNGKDQPSKKQEILDEFSSEAWLDLQLKEAACSSRELFVSSIVLCQELLYAPANGPTATATAADGSSTMRRDGSGFGIELRSSFGLESRVKSSAIFQGTARNLFDRKTDETMTEVQIRLQSIAFHRLMLVRSVLKAMVAVLFCSESSGSRFGLLVGSSPMNLDSWCSLLTPDLYLLICKSLGCAPEAEEEQMAIAIRESLQASTKSLSNSTSFRSGTPSSLGRHNPNSTHLAVSSLWRNTVGDQVSESLLTPIRQKTKTKFFELEEVAPSLRDAQRGVRDLQTIMSFEIARIAAIGYTSLSRNIVLTRNPEAPLSAKMFFGESYTHHTGWETSLQVTLTLTLTQALCLTLTLTI
jgi:hypothetical protein